MEILVSVILPIYNTPEEWVRLAIESVLNQSFKQLECILINDSPFNENLSKLLRKYQKQDSRVVLIENVKSLPKQRIIFTRDFLYLLAI